METHIGTVPTGTPSNPLALNIGSNTVNVLVTAQDTVTTKLYTINVTRRTAYQDWAFGLGLDGVGLDPNGDFDGDGVKNVQEWAFATNPASGTGAAIRVNGAVIQAHGSPTALTVPDGLGESPTSRFSDARKDAESVGLTYEVEFAAALPDWTLSTVTPTVIAMDSEIEAVTIPFPPIVTNPAKGYFRVRVTGQ